jgi:hypothetical protein
MSVAFYREPWYTAVVDFGAAKAVHLRLTKTFYYTDWTSAPPNSGPKCWRLLYFKRPWKFLDNYQRLIQDRLHASGLGKHAKFLVLNLLELPNLNYITYIVANQLARYIGAMVDVISFSLLAMASSQFIKLQPHYSKQIQYSQLYEELKALTLI